MEKQGRESVLQKHSPKRKLEDLQESLCCVSKNKLLKIHHIEDKTNWVLLEWSHSENTTDYDRESIETLHTKYKPQKPKYVNKLFTGYSWNRYNGTHYDSDRPPPKTIFGYQFNLYYPNLIYNTIIPTYSLTTIPDDPGFLVLRFSAGPPYEDIAFKILDKEWDKSYISGYKCQYRRGVLELWFKFKRHIYRK
ncbi:hypothetical protein SNE40_007813 [Patella caerulea]|uniref:Splicing factor Cactin C-terminal domain-containing protein n=1 Tax=Patella caerulea TaxID=87958 RepID=A0AAN8JZC8_PATCE